jgi:HEAT repeat protein
MDEALAEAVSKEYLRRAGAGRVLAGFVDVPVAQDVLVRLLLDPEDTYVTRRTAEALARVGTRAALGVVARAVAEADSNHGDWIEAGMSDVVLSLDNVAELAGVCSQLGGDADGRVRLGAAERLVWLVGMGWTGPRAGL